jgi:hypothetical protein
MKTLTSQILFFIFFVSATQLHAQQNNTIDFHSDLKINQTYALFGDNVNLREKPSTTSKEITRLRIGFGVTILAKTNIIFESNSEKTYWYEVQYKDQKGFLPGKFIAHEVLYRGTHSYFFTKKTTKTYGTQLAIRTLIDNDYSNYKENLIPLRGFLISPKLENAHDLKNVLEILTIKYHGESCGAENGMTYFFLKDDYKLTHIADLSVSGDAGYYESETFTFTKNEYTDEPVILFTKEDSEVVDEDTSWTETKTMSREYTWDGTKLVPSFSKKFYRPEKSN